MIHSSQYYRARRNRHQKKKKKMMCFGLPEMRQKQRHQNDFSYENSDEKRTPCWSKKKKKKNSRTGSSSLLRRWWWVSLRAYEYCVISALLFAKTPPRDRVRKKELV